MRALGFGTYDATKHPRAQIVLDGLAAHGDDVMAVNVPMGFSTAERVAVLAKPWTAWRLIARILRCWLALAAGSFRARRRGSFDVVLVGYLGHFDVILARLLFPRTRIVLDMMIFAADTARDRGATGGLKLALLGALDRLAVACADLVMVDTDEHAGLLSGRSRRKAVVVPVGAPHVWFEAGAARRPRVGGPLRVVFFGLYTPLQGAVTIGRAVAQLADDVEVQVTMIGTGQDLAATREAAGEDSRVSWLDWVGHAELPALVATHDVCLGIFGTTPKALRVVPNKVYQGAAAGCAVLTSDTEPQRRMLADAALLVPSGDPHALACMLAKLAHDRARVRELGAAAQAHANADFTPAAVVTRLRLRLAA